MAPHAILWPIVAMVALVAVVNVRIFFERKRQVRAEGIHMREIPSASQMATRFADTRAADNYRNLFEMPVLFYAALLVAFGIGAATPLTVGLAWAYVGLRIVHSAIHCGYNRVRDRLYAYLASNIVLWTLWILLGIALLQR
ncbi:MAPEG family protein [Luteimonas vadosa]|uniref:MAPEG family protein n=1 Tax=Luteimonas vadosa TaxID=1165507 RepID=A0ABP9E298_9GAMM